MADMEQELLALGQRIKAVRIERGMSQAELAEKANVGLPHISDIERGKTHTKILTFARIAEALQVSADDLLRINIPQVKVLYQSELAEFLKDCTPTEMDSLLQILRQVKAAFQTSQRND